MPRPTEESPGSLGQRTLSPPDSSLDDLESCIEDLDNLGDLDGGGLARKPHFLDYDNKPPAELVEQHNRLNGGASPSEAAVVERLDDAALPCETQYAGEPMPLPHMNASYDTPSSLNILPAAKKPIPTAIGARGTWPLKDRNSPSRRQQQQQHHSLNRELSEVGPKMECVYSLLSMLGSTNVLEMSSKFLELSRNVEKCSALRRSGCVPLLVHIIHNEPNDVARQNARHALVNVIRCNVDEASARREVKVLRLIDQLIDYTDLLKEQHAAAPPPPAVVEGSSIEQERHPIQAIGTLAKISYDEEHRHAMCQFGALQTISSLIQLDHLVHGASPDATKCIEMRRYASMVLTNLTFGQGNNKALLCSNRNFMQALVSQLGCTELLQVTASVLRNLSWRADSVTKQTLIEIGTVKILTESAMRCTVENTLKSILSALWNLSNHCTQNRANICEVDGALEFLIDMLTYDAPSKTMSIVENAGGILRNISSHIAQCEQYRRVLREKNCLKILLDQLKSPSLTVVSNACGTLGNLSSENGEDQRFLRENGAVPMLRSLIYSKHNIISSGSQLALKNLQHHRPAAVAVHGDEKLAEPKDLPSLNVRKQRAMEEELGRAAFYREKAIGNDRAGLMEEEEEDVSDEERAKGGTMVETGGELLESEQPINYSLQDDLHHQQQQSSSSYDYQETDIDQLTDYSLRYAENQSDSDDEKGEAAYGADPVNMLIPEDSVKCYYTEGTPQIISSATSMSDLRAPAQPSSSSFKQVNALKSNPIPIGVVVGGAGSGGGGGGSVGAGGGVGVTGPDDLGCNTPDKPFNYCEEGTPDFSRDASLNIIDLSDADGSKGLGVSTGEHKGEPPADVELVADDGQVVVVGPVSAKSVSFLNTAEETPLMFSRTSSMGSLSSAEPACIDDKSSIVSEFSRLASGVISPSELPDSPTQTIAHSPRRSVSGSLSAASVKVFCQEPFADRVEDDVGGEAPPASRHHPQQQQQQQQEHQQQQQSAFADTMNKFNVENTPAQFSCATSLSNLSIEEKDPDEGEGVVCAAHIQATEHNGQCRSSSPVLPNPAELVTRRSTLSDVDSDVGGDDELLASCISIGMNSVKARSSAKETTATSATATAAPTYANLPLPKAEPPDMLSRSEMLRRYCSETAAARHISGATSTGELSAITIDSERDLPNGDRGPDSDDSSVDESDNNDRLLEECILSGMPKPKHANAGVQQTLQRLAPVEKESPLKMMRTNPVHHLQPLLANDELSPFHVEDSPCNFSTVSALSELTVASDIVTGQTSRPRLERDNRESVAERNAVASVGNQQLLSSPSVASDEDDHLLEEAIATGAIRKAEMAQHRRRNILERTSPMAHAEFKRLISSPGSTETVNSDDEQQEALLQDAIERGMNKGKSGLAMRQETERWVVSSSMPMGVNPTESIPDSDRDEDDYQLLAECIQRGMHTVPKGGTAATQMRHQQQTGGGVGELLAGDLHRLTLNGTRPGAAGMMQTSNPKNVHTTPVILKDVGAAAVSAGVVSSASYQPQSTGTRALPSGSMVPMVPGSIGANTNTTNTAPHRRRSINSSSSSSSNITAAGLSSAVGPASCGRVTPEGGAAPPEPATASASGCDLDLPLADNARSRIPSYGLRRTEPPEDNSLPAGSIPLATEKHKDPEQMLKSVERFTRELVSQSGHGLSDDEAVDGAQEQGTTEPSVMFQLGGQVSFPAFSLTVDETDSLMEFVNLPNIEPPSMLNDDELFATSYTAATTTSLPRTHFLPQFNVAVANMANINSIEPPTMMNESLGSLSSTKWGDGCGGVPETVGSLPKLISSLTQAGTRCNTPPSAAEAGVPIIDEAEFDELHRSIRSQQWTLRDVEPSLKHNAAEPVLPVDRSVTSGGDKKQQAVAVTPAKIASIVTKAPSKERIQRVSQSVSSKLPQQRKSSVVADGDKSTPKKPAYVSPYGRASGLPLTVRTKGGGAVVTRPVPAGQKVSSPTVGRATTGSVVEPKDGTKRNSLTSAGRVPPVGHSPGAGVKSPAASSNESVKQLAKGSAKRVTPAAGRVSSAIRQTTPAGKGKQPNGGIPKCNATPPQATIPASPGTEPKVVLLTRQQTFVNEKPSMAALPHISSAPSSPAKARKAASGEGARARAEVLARANTTLPNRSPRTPVHSVAGSRLSRIPPPSTRLPAGVGLTGTRKDGGG
ncbi:adenomatous polyposis coli homolog isoform X2 [Anopheles coustani]|uniref:adenomatous polyposis coli homolog isoform X2 n=1 Tax=Anopheles coustani TaxID=139045 RepID=UPI0026598B08|nr:adenomatous polyposis coli homolog isoform X2 [Anopheles coustani]